MRGPIASLLNHDYGERLKNARALSGMSLNELSRLMGISPTTIYKIENGLSTRVKVETKDAIDIFISEYGEGSE